MTKKNTGIAAIIIFTLSALCHFLHLEKIWVLQHLLLQILRWAFIAVMIACALAKQSLTTEPVRVLRTE